MYNVETLKKFTEDVMASTGLKRESAALFADALLYADMRGIGSHGLTRLTTYYSRLRDGLVDPQAEPSIRSDFPALIRVEGNNALGVVSASFAMKTCIEHAKTAGACYAPVNGGNHFGCASYYAEMAAREGMIGIAMANGPVAVAPIGGKEPMLGTNPLAIAIPMEGRNPFVLDMATSVVARGKIKLAEKEGRTIPEGWGIDEEGHPTTDPSKVKCVLPFGGAKGYGISMIIDILCSVLANAKNSQTMGSFYDFSGKKQEAGFFLGALNPAAIMDEADFLKGTRDFADSIKNSVKAEGTAEIFVPGEIEYRKQQSALTEGIKLSDVIVAELRKLSEETGVALDI